MASNYGITTRSRSSSPFKKIKKFFKPSSRSSSSHKNERKDSDDIGQMTERSYYHVGSQRLYPPPHSAQDDDISRRSMEGQSNLDDEDTYQYAVERHSNKSLYHYDVSEISNNPLYRPEDDETNNIEIDKRYHVRGNEVRHHEFNNRVYLVAQLSKLPHYFCCNRVCIYKVLFLTTL